MVCWFRKGGEGMDYCKYRDDQFFMHYSKDEHPNALAFKMHAHEKLELYYFLSGDAYFMIEGNKYPLHPHDLLIMRQAEVHALTITSDAPYCRMAIHFPADAFDSLDPERKLLRPFFERPLGSGNLFAAAQYPNAHWHDAFARLDFSGNQKAHFSTLAGIIEILSELGEAFDGGQQSSGVEHGFAAELVSYVNEHLFEDLSLGSTAAAFFRSKSQISRTFRDATGIPFWDYVILKRLMAARAYLQNGESSERTCEKCGFGDYSAFYRAYKARFGCSPSVDIRRG